jgi:hypothetical protein
MVAGLARGCPRSGLAYPVTAGLPMEGALSASGETSIQAWPPAEVQNAAIIQ